MLNISMAKLLVCVPANDGEVCMQCHTKVCR